MAQRVVVTTVDDFDGESAADETIVFGLDGVTYEIDLSAANAERLRAELEEWTRHARRVGGRRKRAGEQGAAGRAGEDATAIRRWARENGFDISSRGRVPDEVVAAYRTAHPARS